VKIGAAIDGLEERLSPRAELIEAELRERKARLR